VRSRGLNGMRQRESPSQERVGGIRKGRVVCRETERENEARERRK
jgi:hypothetical protein